MIQYLEHHIVDHCNLNCAGCSHFSCLADPWFENIDDFYRDFEELSKLTDQQINTIRIMGGEPLLHPNFDQFLIIARKLFPYSNIQIVTNGLLINQYKNKLKKVCNENNILLCISNYHLLDLSTILENFNNPIRIDEKNYLYNISLNLNGTLNQEQCFNNCDLHINKWYYFQHGSFYRCCIAANIHIFEKYFNLKLTDSNKEDFSISIYSHSLDEIEKFLNTPFCLCSFCNTNLRLKTYHPFYQTKGDIIEWTYQ